MIILLDQSSVFSATKSMVQVKDININFEIQGSLIVFMIPKTCTLGHFID